ncbi:hypothetical protein ILYODFUR_012172 [Ilyodon furcidens]|uniref:Uncharacterized protein n=1 Tax=Ilyodon furcidens TaxID=33524 RepID=A0ABV0URI3_9TELE
MKFFSPLDRRTGAPFRGNLLVASRGLDLAGDGLTAPAQSSGGRDCGRMKQRAPQIWIYEEESWRKLS